MTFEIVSLGCPKNLVDSEYICKRLEQAGYTLERGSNLVLVNTCAFINEACKESIETILSLARDGKDVIVAGCLVERYGDRLRDLMPEIHLFVGRGFYPEIPRLLNNKGCFVKEARFEPSPRTILTERPVSFLKTHEGCNNRCTYCLIPSIRGPVRSRTVEHIKREFLWLLRHGYKEVNLVAQDLTAYGRDMGVDLKILLKELLSVREEFYLRLLYLHPRGIDRELVQLIKEDSRIVKYLDVPIQHSEDRILNLMGRGYTKDGLERLLGLLRSELEDVTLRTTVMVGFPGETEEEFEALLNFIKKWEFDMLGAFMYSREEGTESAKLKGNVPKKVSKRRYEILMGEQMEISKKRLKRLEGRTTKVICEGRDGDYMVGRALFQAPLVDGLCFIRGDCEKGQIREGRVVKALHYDLVVEV